MASLTMMPSSTYSHALARPSVLHASHASSWRASAEQSSKSAAEADWRVKRQLLISRGVRSVDASEARQLQQQEGYTLLDVRPKADYAEMHPVGAVNVELFRLIKEWTAWDIARRIGFGLFGIFEGTEENPEFLKEVDSKLDKASPIIVACSMGGTLKSTRSLAEGKESRSLIAAYLLALANYTNIIHLEGGVQAWAMAGLPIERYLDLKVDTEFMCVWIGPYSDCFVWSELCGGEGYAATCMSLSYSRLTAVRDCEMLECKIDNSLFPF